MSSRNEPGESSSRSRGRSEDDAIHPVGSTARDPSPFSHNVLDEVGGTELYRSESRRSRQSRNEERRNSHPAVSYYTPANYRNLDEVSDQPPIQNPDEEVIRHDTRREDESEDLDGRGRAGRRRASTSLSTTSARVDREARMARRRSVITRVDYDAPDVYANLDEVAASSPVQNPDEAPIYRHESLEELRTRDQEYRRSMSLHRRPSASRQTVLPEAPETEKEPSEQREIHVSRLATQVYTISYLVFFSFWGTLARVGLQALTTYPGSPLIFPSIWPNFTGCVIMGFLAEDRMLFRFEWGTPTYELQLRQAKQDEESASGSSDRPGPGVDLAAARKDYMATKKTIPLYIGLATGFCGSFTSFSSFIRDVFLALSNDLTTPDSTSGIASRNGGYSFMALLAVTITTVSLSLSGLFIGAHLAIAIEPLTPSLPYLITRKVLDRLVVFLAWGSWVGAILLSALPPDRNSGSAETWRGGATFALVFAPLGCLLRFYASLHLNGRIAAFPLGTFAVNVFGTSVLGMAYDLQHVSSLGGVVGCQVLQGIEDGFCGCLTTVSTWASELAALMRTHAWVYGLASVVVSLAAMIVIMGSLKWTDGYAALQCIN